MCDYSLQAIASRLVVAGESLITKYFNSGTTGFAPDSGEEIAVCVLPGTELAFDESIIATGIGTEFYPSTYKTLAAKVGRFRQIKKDEKYAHHDAVELPTGEIVLLASLKPGQRATVLQLPAITKGQMGFADGLSLQHL